MNNELSAPRIMPTAAEEALAIVAARPDDYEAVKRGFEEWAQHGGRASVIEASRAFEAAALSHPGPGFEDEVLAEGLEDVAAILGRQRNHTSAGSLLAAAKRLRSIPHGPDMIAHEMYAAFRAGVRFGARGDNEEVSDEKKLDLEAIEERASSATPGPWRVVPMSDSSGVPYDEPGAYACQGCGEIHVCETRIDRELGDFGSVLSERPYDIFGCSALGDQGEAQAVANARFAAAAREDVPALVAELRETREQVAALARTMLEQSKSVESLTLLYRSAFEGRESAEARIATVQARIATARRYLDASYKHWHGDASCDASCVPRILTEIREALDAKEVEVLPCGAPLPKARVALNCSLSAGHTTPHRAELDRIGGEAFVQWPLDWKGPGD